MKPPPAEAGEITRASKSNLALAFVALPRDRREDITIFYAWCRLIDDIADDPGFTREQRQAALGIWSQALVEPAAGESPLAGPVRGLIARRKLPIEHFREILAGVEMDLAGARYQTWEDLRLYCYRVASAVGLVSIEIFGCREPASRDYAVNLGLALQLTNILRDVHEDWGNGGRLYLPLEDLARFGYTLEDLAAGTWNEAFLALMRFEAERAHSLFAQVDSLRPEADRRALVAAEIMRSVYGRILARMEWDRFRVFSRRYRLGGAEKLLLVAWGLFKARFL